LKEQIRPLSAVAKAMADRFTLSISPPNGVETRAPLSRMLDEEDGKAGEGR
jgi:hypothetical protein